MSFLIELRRAAHPLVISLQQRLQLLPHDLCLVSGAPRSRTSALLDRLCIQKDITKNCERFLANVRSILSKSTFHLIICNLVATIWSMASRTWGSSLAESHSERFSLEEYAKNWCAFTNLILHFCSDPGTYIFQFGNLVNHPNLESQKIFNFLNILEREPFQPRQTSQMGFSEEQSKTILSIVQPIKDQLYSQGIKNLF